MKKILLLTLVVLIYGCGEKNTASPVLKAPVCGDKSSLDLVYQVLEKEIKKTIESDINGKRAMQALKPGDRDSIHNFDKVTPQEVEGMYKFLNPNVVHIVTNFQDDKILQTGCSATINYSNNTSEQINYTLAISSEKQLLISLTFVD